MDFKKFFKKDEEKIRSAHQSDNHIQQNHKLKNWDKDRYQSAVAQRNLLLLLLTICFAVILISLSTIRYLKNTQNIEPFVIEIEEKTGVPTVVEPLSVKAYSANEAVTKYFVMKYIRAREEYFPTTFARNFNDVVRTLSDHKVYYEDYKPKFSTNSKTSPYNLYGSNSYATVSLKSIIFPTPSSAQVRVTITVTGQINLKMNKIIYMEFTFRNLNMSEEDRLINPLGFQVTLFRMNDENE
jgi:type IV secretion system protein VirB8